MINFILDFKIRRLLSHIYGSMNEFNIMHGRDIPSRINDRDFRKKQVRLEELSIMKNNFREDFKKRLEILSLCLESDRKIPIDKDILEDLLFDEIVIDEESTAKILVWTGDFLRKIDLSEVSFEDVFWSYDEYCNGGILGQANYINLSCSNANIDFSKSFESKILTGAFFNLRNCSFRGVDLSNSHITDVFNCFENCDLRDTGIKFDNRNVELMNCDIDGVKGRGLSRNKLANGNPNSNQN